MMDTQVAVSDAVKLLKQAALACREAGFYTVSIEFWNSHNLQEPKISVHLFDPSQLKEIPGRSVEVTHNPEFKYPYRLTKRSNGVEFFSICNSDEVQKVIADA